MYYNEADRRLTERVQRPRMDFSDTPTARVGVKALGGVSLGVTAGLISASINPGLNDVLIAGVVGFLGSMLTGFLWEKRAERRDRLRRQSILDYFAQERERL